MTRPLGWDDDDLDGERWLPDDYPLPAPPPVRDWDWIWLALILAALALGTISLVFVVT